MKKVLLILALAVSASQPLQAMNNGEAPSPSFTSFLNNFVQALQQCTFGREAQVREAQVCETQDSVVVHVPIQQVCNIEAVLLELCRMSGDLYACVCYPLGDGSGLKYQSHVPIPTLPCPVVVEQAKLTLTSATELQVTFPKAQASLQ